MADYATAPLPVTGNLNIADPTTLTKATVTLGGQLNVQTPAMPVFNEAFEGGTVDTTNRWNAPVLAGTGTVTQASALGLVVAVGTTASNGAALSSIPTFPTQYASAVSFATGLKVEATTIATGNHRFFGFGTPGTAYSTTNPIQDGIGFEITTAGVLRAVIYASDVLLFSQALTIPTDGLEHVFFFTSQGTFVTWYVDTFAAPIAINTSVVNAPNVTILPIRYHSLNGGSTTVGTPLMTAYGCSVLDSAGTSIQISDGTYPWRKATINTAAQLGALNVVTYERVAKTYSACASVALAAAATDIAILPGSASRTVYVTKVTISGVQTTGGVNDIQLIKRSAANTGGTSIGMTVIPYDSTDGAATVAPLSYTANPTPGAAVGTALRAYSSFPTATAAVNPIQTFVFGEMGRPIVLRGVAQGLAVNFGGATLTGGVVDINYEWFEI